jgi:hypothetical protein
MYVPQGYVALPQFLPGPYPCCMYVFTFVVLLVDERLLSRQIGGPATIWTQLQKGQKSKLVPGFRLGTRG